MIEDKDAIPRCFARSVVIGIKNRQHCRIFHIISFEIVNVECDLDFVITRNQRQVRDFADKNLSADSFAPTPFRLEDAMRSKDPLTEYAVESQAGIQTRGGLLQIRNTVA